MIKRWVQLLIIKNRYEYCQHKAWVCSVESGSEHTWWVEKAEFYEKKYNDLRFWFQQPLAD